MINKYQYYVYWSRVSQFYLREIRWHWWVTRVQASNREIMELHNFPTYTTVQICGYALLNGYWQSHCKWSFTSYLKDTKNLDYWVRLKVLKIYSIEYRCKMCWIMHIRKMFECKSPKHGMITYHSKRYGRLGKVHFVVVVLCHSNSISVISWWRYDVWDEKEKARAYTFTDSRDL